MIVEATTTQTSMLWMVIAVLSVASIVVTLLTRSRNGKKDQSQPDYMRLSCPKGLPVLGNLLDFARNHTDQERLFHRWQKEFGNIFRFRLLSHDFVFLSNPEDIQKVLKNHNQKTEIYSALRPALGDGLATCGSGSVWKEARRLCVRAFSTRFLRDSMHSFRFVSRRMCSQLNKHISQSEKEVATLDMNIELSKLTADSTAHALFGEDLKVQITSGSHILDALETACNESMKFTFLPFLKYFPNTKLTKSIETLDKFAYGTIQKFRDHPIAEDGQHNFASLLLQNQEELRKEGQNVPDKLLRDQLVTFLLAGNDNSAQVLTWALYLITKDPECHKAVLDELDQVLEDRDSPEWDDLPKLSVLKACINETMRLYPPGGTALSRVLLHDDEFQGVKVPKGTKVWLGMYAMHHDPAIWSKAEEFDPSRFLPTSEGKLKYKAATHIPFSSGGHHCIGKQFAMFEMQVVLATVLKAFDFSVVPGHVIDQETQIALKPKYGMNMHISRRPAQ